MCTATLPAEGSKEVNIRKILNVEGVEEQFFTCGRACASTMYGANLQSPKARRVIDNLWAALAPTLGTRLRAGDAAEIMTDDLSSGRQVFKGLVRVESIISDPKLGTTLRTTLRVRYQIGNNVVEVAPFDLESRGEAAERISREEMAVGEARSRWSTRRSSSMSTSSLSNSSVSSFTSPSSQEAASLRAGMAAQHRRAVHAETSLECAVSQAAGDRARADRCQEVAARRVATFKADAEAAISAAISAARIDVDQAAKVRVRAGRVAAHALTSVDNARRKAEEVRTEAMAKRDDLVRQRDEARRRRRQAEKETNKLERRVASGESARDELPSLRARALELEDELARRADAAAAAAAADAADASKWRSLRLPRRVTRSSVGGVEYDDETQLTANLLMATGASAPVVEEIWRIVLRQTLGDGVVEGEDYVVPSQDHLNRKRAQNASIDEQMTGRELAAAEVIHQLGCDETGLNGVSMQASFAKIGNERRLAMQGVQVSKTGAGTASCVKRTFDRVGK